MQDILACGHDPWKGKFIAILANHFGQNRLNKAVFGSHPGLAHIDTVGRFQGKEADIVILTLASENAGFFATNAQQFIACSRARHGLFIVGEIAKWKNRQQVKHLMDALSAVATGQPIPLTRVHTIETLLRFTADAPPHLTTDWVICTRMPMGKALLQTIFLQPQILAPIWQIGSVAPILQHWAAFYIPIAHEFSQTSWPFQSQHTCKGSLFNSNLTP